MFKVGQKVVCVKPFIGVWIETNRPHNYPLPKVDEVYTIKRFNNGGHLILFNMPEIGYNREKFRPLDYTFAEQVESMVNEFAEEQESVLI